MRNKAVKYYNQGYNCSQCVLKAVEQDYNIQVPKQCFRMCSCLANGFGVGEMCSVLIAGIMIFGLLFEPPIAKRMRIKLLSEFNESHPSMNCAALVKGRGKSSGCEELISEIYEIMERLIQEEL